MNKYEMLSINKVAKITHKSNATIKMLFIQNKIKNTKLGQRYYTMLYLLEQYMENENE